ncbi:MAG: Asp-tRNA(Asn)/Glu-tRNA(Gln) amidotransferase subunit GatC [Candidatus Omnitrophota bacterium]
MNIKREIIGEVANLARIELSKEEELIFTKQLYSVLDYIEKLNQLNTGQIFPTSYVLELNNVYRKDESAESLPVEEVLKNAPEHDHKFFIVPKVIFAAQK